MGLACCSLPLSACSTPADPVGQGDAAPEDDTVAEDDDFGPPEEEQTGTEAPADAGAERIALELPGLPIGGSTTVVSETLQCAGVNWSGPPDLIEGVRIEVTAVSFDPPGAFTLADDVCPDDRPPCLPTMPTSGEPCTVAIAWTGEPAPGGGELSFSSGHVICEPGAEQTCRTFQQEVVAEGPDGIELAPPPDVADGTGDGTGDGSVDGSDDTGGVGTDESTTGTDPDDGTADGDGTGDDDVGDDDETDG